MHHVFNTKEAWHLPKKTINDSIGIIKWCQMVSPNRKWWWSCVTSQNFIFRDSNSSSFHTISICQLWKSKRRTLKFAIYICQALRMDVFNILVQDRQVWVRSCSKGERVLNGEFFTWFKRWCQVMLTRLWNDFDSLTSQQNMTNVQKPGLSPEIPIHLKW